MTELIYRPDKAWAEELRPPAAQDWATRPSVPTNLQSHLGLLCISSA